MRERNNINKGFTIVELLVAMSVFVTAMSIISGLFIKTLHTQKILGAVIESSSNTSLMLEQMAREIRLGYFFTTSTVPCGGGQTDFYQGLAFKRLRGATSTVVAYEWNTTNSILERTEEMNATEALTSANVTASRLCFRVSQGGLPNNPWRITILSNVSPKIAEATGKGANLQTTISSRILPTDVTNPGVCLGGWLARFTNWTRCP